MAWLDPHPDPPADWDRELPLKKFKRSWLRIHQLENEPLFFGKSGKNRFDAPSKEFGVLYAARDFCGAFIETLGDLDQYRLIPEYEVAKRGLARIVPARALRLVDLSGEGLAQLVADARMTAGDNRALSLKWALWIHRHPQVPDGIVYRARHDQSQACVALFDRVASDLAVEKLGALADPRHESLLGKALNKYKFALYDSPPHVGPPAGPV